MSQQSDAALGLLVFCAEDMYTRAPTMLDPPPDPRLSPEWIVLGYLTAQDAIFREGATLAWDLRQVSCYGFLARSVTDPSRYVAAIRGTEGVLAWVDDAKFSQTTHPIAGMVEVGFYGIYRSLRYTPIGANVASQDANLGIAEAVGAGSVTVIGHSLGSAIGTYLALDLAHDGLGHRVSLLTLASPHPGNQAFAAAVNVLVPDHRAYAYDLDIVPKMPFGFDYCSLPGLIILRPGSVQARIKMAIGCWHHIASYLAMMDYSLMDWATVPCFDADMASCIKGPLADTWRR